MKVKVQFVNPFDPMVQPGYTIVEAEVSSHLTFTEFISEVLRDGFYLNSERMDWVPPHVIQRIWLVERKKRIQ